MLPAAERARRCSGIPRHDWRGAVNTPAYARALIDRRNRGVPTDSVFVSVGWPTQWLQEFVSRFPLNRLAVILATPEARQYDYAATVGLSVCVWYEQGSDASRVEEIASDVLKANPNRLFTTNAVTGETVFYKTATEQKEAA